MIIRVRPITCMGANVHYLSDVIAVYTLGTLWLAVCFTWLELVHKRAALRRAASH